MLTPDLLKARAEKLDAVMAYGIKHYGWRKLPLKHETRSSPEARFAVDYGAEFSLVTGAWREERNMVCSMLRLTGGEGLEVRPSVDQAACSIEREAKSIAADVHRRMVTGGRAGYDKARAKLDNMLGAQRKLLDLRAKALALGFHDKERLQGRTGSLYMQHPELGECSLDDEGRVTPRYPFTFDLGDTLRITAYLRRR